MLTSTALMCIVDLTSVVDLLCVCWNVMYAEVLMPWCYLVAGASTSLFVDLSGPPWHLAIVWTPEYSVVSICVT